MTQPGEPIPTRLPGHAEHYDRVEAAYGLAFGEVADLINPYVDMYRDAGVPFDLLTGATLRFEVGQSTTVLATLGVRPDEEAITSYFLIRTTLAPDNTETELLGSLNPVIKTYNPGQFAKYHGQRSIDSAREIARTLADPRRHLMGFELRPLHRNPDGTIFYLGRRAVAS